MYTFLKKETKGKTFELEIDTYIFSKDIVLKAAYQYLDIGYFFFKIGENSSMIVQFTPKEGKKQKPEEIIGDFTDTLLETQLRDTLEKDNRVIREAIITKALYGGNTETQQDDTQNMIELGDPDQNASELDFDKDIEDIIKEIENDPDLQIDEDEIQKMLDEIEKDGGVSVENKPSFTLDPSHLDGAKDIFKKKK